MVNNDDTGSKKPPTTSTSSGPGSKRPSAILDLKAADVEISGTDGKTEEANETAKGNASEESATSARSTSAGAQSADSTKQAKETAGAAPDVPATSLSDPADQPRTSTFTSFMTHLAAGVAGGLLALIGADSLNMHLGVDPALHAVSSAELVARVAALEQNRQAQTNEAGLAALEQRLTAAETRMSGLADVEAAVTQLRQTQSDIATKLGAAAAAPDSTMVERLAKLEETMRTLASAASTEGGQTSSRVPQLAAITGKLADLETALASRIASVRKAVSEEIEKRTGKIAEASEAARAGMVRIDRDVTGLKANTAKLTDTISSLQADQERTTKSLADLKSEATALNADLGALRQRLQTEVQTVLRPGDLKESLSPLSARLAGLEQGIKDIVSREGTYQKSSEHALLALELANLRRAVEAGGAYADELSNVNRSAGGQLKLTALDRFKNSGVPTLRELSAEFGKLSHRIIAADTPPEAGTLIDRFLTGAKSVVRIRRVGDNVEGNSTEAIVARMEAALEKGNLEQVLEEGRSLSERNRIPAAREWLEKVEARVAASTALRDVERQLKASLGSPATARSNSKNSGQ